MLSVVIPTHQRTDLLEACLQSVARYAPPDTQIIVVDDCSPNNAAVTVASLFPAVNVVRMSMRRGFCAAVNAGIYAACGDIVEVLNDDTEVTAGWTNAALAVFQNQSDVAAVAPLVLRWPDGERIDSAGDRYYVGGVAGKRGLGQAPNGEFLQARYVFGASGCGAFYRRAVLQKVGAFPEEFGAYFDDIDVSFRLRRAGYQIWYEPRSRILHHGSASYGQPGDALLQQQSRNEERVFWRNTPTDQLYKAVPKHLAVLAAKAFRRWREGQLLPFVRGRAEAFLEARTIRAHRRKLRALKCAEPRLYLDTSWWRNRG
jgi:GT2 family glycosyltransferase